MKKKIINKNQQGAALVMVMSLLAGGLIVGVSGMNASYIDERLAGNYQARSAAQIAAETAASFALNDDSSFSEESFKETSFSVDEISEIGWEEFLNDSNFDDQEVSDDFCVEGVIECYSRYVSIKNTAGEEEQYIVAMGSVGSDAKAISRPVLVEVSLGGLPELTSVDAAVSCVGSDCFYSPGSGKASPSVDGTNRPKDIKIQGASKNMESDPLSPNVAGIVMPDIPSSKGAGGGGGGYVGAPGEVYSDSSTLYEELDTVKERVDEEGNVESWEKAKSRINSYIDEFLEFADSTTSDNIYYAGEGETVSPGSSEGIVVINGGKLSLKGNDAFRGLVIVSGEEGCADDDEKSCGEIEAGGTPAIVGAVIGRNYTFSGSGTPSIFYSREAIEDSQNIDVSGGGKASVVSWK